MDHSNAMRSSHENVFSGTLRPILFIQDHVFVFTSGDDGSAGVWIPGFLAVFSGGIAGQDVPRLAWTSYERVRQFHSSTGERKRPLQVTDVPAAPTQLEQFTLKMALSECYSVWKHTPDLGRGVPVVRVTLQGGRELPPFLFYHGGVRELFHALRTLMPLSRDRSDPNLYIFNGDNSVLFSHVSCADEFASEAADDTPGNPSASLQAAPARSPSKSGSSVLGAAVGVLSSVGRLARHVIPLSSAAKPTAKQPVVQEQNKEEAPNPAPRSADFSASITDFHMVDDYRPSDNDRFLESVVPRPERSNGVDEEMWFLAFDSDGRISEEKRAVLCQQAFSGGIHPTVRREMWKYLLRYYAWDSTYDERVELRRMREAEYHIYKQQWMSITPLQASHFSKFRDRKHAIEKDTMRTDRLEPFFAARNGSEDTNHFDPAQNTHLATLHDILLSYTFFNFDIGYCQGMNDLLAPILSEIEDEVDSFWCFKGLMDRMSPNFRKDQSGMHAQLRRLQGIIKLMDEELFKYLVSIEGDNCFWAFRWILLHFKRELDYDGTKMVWEAIWSAESEHFHLFLVLAVVETVRDHILMEKLQFDALLQMCNHMSGKLQYPELLSSASYHYSRWTRMFPEEVRARVLL